MGVVLLIRHADTDQTGRRLYGRTPGVHLSERGRAQAERLARRLDGVVLAAVYTSPMERCRETAAPIVAGRGIRPRVVRDLNEVDYGRWTGRSFGALRRTKAWKLVRSAPATVRFPDGETLFEVQQRAVAALEELSGRHPDAAIAAVSHGDVIRLSLAHYAGIHLDLFQRLEVGTASVAALGLGDGGPRILRVNDAGELAELAPRGARGDEKVGG